MAFCSAPTQAEAAQQAAASGRWLQVMMLGLLVQSMALIMALVAVCHTLLVEAASLLQSSSQEPLAEAAAAEAPEEETAPRAAAPPAAQSDDGPVTWHTNATASEVTWSLNPLAVDMDPAAFFDLGYGDLTDLEMMTSSYERPPSPKAKSMRRPMLTISIPERTESSQVLDEHIACEELRPRTPAPLVALTPSEVNARASLSPLSVLVRFLKASEGRAATMAGTRPRGTLPTRGARQSRRESGGAGQSGRWVGDRHWSSSPQPRSLARAGRLHGRGTGQGCPTLLPPLEDI